MAVLFHFLAFKLIPALESIKIKCYCFQNYPFACVVCVVSVIRHEMHVRPNHSCHVQIPEMRVFCSQLLYLMLLLLL